ncbi:MAG: ABC transporter substrate-binding protein [Chitinophagales bacterium]|nr:ABC transporter substrate-binding protein [Chitinophagales bacterium]
MKIKIQFLFFLLCGIILLYTCANPTQQHDAAGHTAPSSDTRIVALSGGITEVLYTLGHGNKIVGVDVTSTFPEEVKELPQLGHIRNLNAEAILALAPNLIVAEAKDSSNQILQQLANSGIELLFLESTNHPDKPILQAEVLAKKLGSEASLQTLKEQHLQDIQELQQIKEKNTYEPRVLFVYARGKGSMMVAGRNTSASSMIELAGGKNAILDFEGFKALSAEGLIEAQPDVLLLFKSGLQSLGGQEGLLQVPGLSQTPAGVNQRFIAMDGLYLLGFTPRVGKAAIDLAKQLQAFNYEDQLTQNKD